MKNIIILLLITIITGYVTRVKDGDSIFVRSKGLIYEIRLYGIDAPEYRQKGGKAASQNKQVRYLVSHDHANDPRKLPSRQKNHTHII